MPSLSRLTRPAGRAAWPLALALAACTVTGETGPEPKPSADITPAKVSAAPLTTGGRVAPMDTRPDWLKRVALNSVKTDSGIPNVSLVSLQPLPTGMSEDELLFAQMRVNMREMAIDPRAVSNGGIGYRRLVFGGDMLAGISGFYDRDWRDTHARTGSGAEIKWQALDLSVNYYKGLTIAENGSAALDGYDVAFASTLPYLPWAEARFTRTAYFTDDEERADALNHYTAGMRLALTPHLRLESRTRDGESGYVGLHFRYDGKPSKSDTHYAFSDTPIAAVPFEGRNLRRHMLDKVRRGTEIVLGG